MTTSAMKAPVIRALVLSIKDGLRGIRHILISLRNSLSRVGKVSPAPVRQFGQVLVHHFDQLADRVDRNTSSMVHRYLDPAISRRADVAVLSRITTFDEATASVIFAKISYDNLKTAIAYLCDKTDNEGHFFVSEALGAVAYGRAAAGFEAAGQENASDENARAAVLSQALLRVGMVRTGGSANAASAADAATRKIAELGVFASVLWLVIERESTPESEDGLLIDCCDLALAQAETITSALEDTQLLAELVTFSRDSV